MSEVEGEVEDMAKRQVLPENAGLCNCAELEQARARVAELTEALEKLARLGNEPFEGNSDGNRIAQRALLTSGVSPEHHRAASESAVAGWELRRRRAAKA